MGHFLDIASSMGLTSGAGAGPAAGSPAVAVWLPSAVFLAGLIGSPHCASMCGPLIMNFTRSKASRMAYQLGRMVSYSVAGALVGAFGSTLFGASPNLWLSKLSLLMLFTLIALNGYRTLTGKPLHLSFPRWLARSLSPLSARLMPRGLPSMPTKLWQTLSPSRGQGENLSGSAFAGSLSVFLPCGHLYSFLLGAVATQSALGGAFYMFAFWLGSAPPLYFATHWLQRLFQSRNINSRRLGGFILMCAGFFSIMIFSSQLSRIQPSHHAHHLSATGILDPAGPAKDQTTGSGTGSGIGTGIGSSNASDDYICH